MIREILPDELGAVKSFLEEDILRNYFILLGMVSSKQVYEKIYGQWKDQKLVGTLFKRKSGNLQFYGEEGFDLEGFTKLISTIDYNSLIGPKSYCNEFLNQGIFSSYRGGAYLSELGKDSNIESIDNRNVHKLEIEDLDRVVSLYQEVFSSFASLETMEEKLKSNRGRGVFIEEDGEILSLAQSEFEMDNGALIVGVATRPELQGQGLASKVLKV